MSTTRKTGCTYAILSVLTIIFTIVLFIIIGLFVPAANLLWNGIPAQGTIVGADSCQSTKEPGFNYTMRFTDQAGHVHLATLHGCGVTMPSTSSFTIIYLANDPETIDLPSAAPFLVLTHASFCRLSLRDISL